MKNLKILALGAAILGLAAGSEATLFVTTLFTTAADDTPTPNVGQSFSVSGNSYTANFTSAVVTAPRTFLDITWWQSFDTTQATAGSPAVPLGYDSVTQIITGRYRSTTGQSFSASFEMLLTEQVLTMNGTGNGSSNPSFTVNVNATSSYQPFSQSVTTVFNTAMTQGVVQKDDLFVNSAPGLEIVIDSIEQRYNPVPEPATMAALGLGALALARRKRK